MKTLYVDMDGTLAKFYEKAYCMEQYKEPGFFEGLNPYKNAVEAIEILCRDHSDQIRIIILSAAEGDSARSEKVQWLKDHLSLPVPYIFTIPGESKAEYISELTENEFLLDDYSANLIDWETHGGTSIKFRNEINGRGWNGNNFRGHTVYYDQNPEDLAHDLMVCTGILTAEEKCSPDEPITEEQMREAIDKVMSGESAWRKEENVWITEIYADYDDYFCENNLRQIFQSEDPRLRFYELMSECYEYREYDEIYSISEIVRKEIGKLGGAFRLDEYNYFDDPDVESIYQDLLDDGIFQVELPYDHYLKQKIKVNIMIDTGDADRDFTDNCVAPHWDADKGEEIRDTASIVWLAKTQGLDKKALEAGLAEYSDGLGKSGFIGTLGQELINMPSHMIVLTFLVEMTLGQALTICDFKQLESNSGSITIGKETMTGLYDPWSGGGSVFEIELEKDVEIPMQFIYSCMPDGADGNYSVSDVYGMCGSAWKPTLKSIKLPETSAA